MKRFEQLFVICVVSFFLGFVVASMVTINEVIDMKNKIVRLNAHIDRQESVIISMEEFINGEK